MLRGEVRSTALDLTNASDQGLALPLRVTGLQLPAEALSVHELVYTATQQGGSTASALPEAKRTANGWEIDLPAGATRQIWLMVDSGKLAAGQQQGQVVVQPAGGSAVTVPFRLRVSTVAMPARPSLSLGGWDYTDTSTYGVTDANRQQVVEFLKRYHVDTPWATGRAMPFGKHAADGTMTEPPDTKYTDAWLDRWQGARQYAVFNAFPEVLPDTPAAKKRVTEWINFWVGHLKTKGIEPRQLLLLLFDEPHEARSDQVIISYARVIKAAQSEVSIFNDPTYRDPRQATKEMLDLSDILCPNRPMWIENRAAFEAVYPGRRAAGQRLALYSCSGPVRLLDPYSYHRVQGWEAFRLDADGMYYWAFGDNGGHSAWNELAAPGTCYSPAFIGPEGIVTSRQMEAIREGIYDYEYLTLLRAAVAAADKANRQDAAAKAARKLLEEAPGRVLGAAGMNSIEWSTPKDRDLADRVRIEIIEALEKLG
ncbi:MAG: hypothetical protein HUU35_07785 [Armatimonadetes bacterium]|nr:hypothetical protein [Armatimonadota bacterium]